MSDIYSNYSALSMQSLQSLLQARAATNEETAHGNGVRDDVNHDFDTTNPSLFEIDIRSAGDNMMEYFSDNNLHIPFTETTEAVQTDDTVVVVTNSQENGHVVPDNGNDCNDAILNSCSEEVAIYNHSTEYSSSINEIELASSETFINKQRTPEQMFSDYGRADDRERILDLEATIHLMENNEKRYIAIFYRLLITLCILYYYILCRHASESSCLSITNTELQSSLDKLRQAYDVSMEENNALKEEVSWGNQSSYQSGIIKFLLHCGVI